MNLCQGSVNVWFVSPALLPHHQIPWVWCGRGREPFDKDHRLSGFSSFFFSFWSPTFRRPVSDQQFKWKHQTLRPVWDPDSSSRTAFCSHLEPLPGASGSWSASPLSACFLLSIVHHLSCTTYQLNKIRFILVLIFTLRDPPVYKESLKAT